MERAELKAMLRATGRAIECGEFVFLCDSNWSSAERADADRQIAIARTTKIDPGLGWLGVRTGGSGGGVKFARHDEKTLSAAVSGFRTHFGMTRVNAVDVLPPHHVSGLMARVRCAATGGRHVAWGWKTLESGETPAIAGDEWVVSLVPTQLQRLLGSPVMIAWLRRFRIIFLGGGPLWAELADAAAAAQLRVSPSYGMTETAAMVAALQPDAFLAGTRSSGTVLPHARVSIDANEGVIKIAGASVFRGYWPDSRETAEFTTDDLGWFDERGHLRILGRRDAMIITGGEKVNPLDVEAALRASGEFSDVAVIGIPDREWGEVVVACYPRDVRRPDVTRASARLGNFQRPKRWVEIEQWPRNAQGKVNRSALRETVTARSVDPDPKAT